MLLVPIILYLYCLGLLLFNKYHQCVYQFLNTGFICYCFCQAPIIVAKLTIFQSYPLVFFHIPLHLFLDFLCTTHKFDLEHGIYTGLCQYFIRKKHVYIIFYYQVKLLNIVIQKWPLIAFFYFSLFKKIFDPYNIYCFFYIGSKTHCTFIILYLFWVM